MNQGLEAAENQGPEKTSTVLFEGHLVFENIWYYSRAIYILL